MIALVVDPQPATSRAFVEALAELGFRVVTTTSGSEALEHLHSTLPSLVLLDLEISDIPGRRLLRHFRKHAVQTPIIALSRSVDVRTAVGVVRAGATEVVDKSSSRENFHLAVQQVLSKARAANREGSDRERVLFFTRYGGLFRRSEGMRGVETLVMRVATTDGPVLIRGEPGTGKELVAKAIHYLSGRSGKPWQRLNCASLPADLLESEIFGQGGKLELADGGTLLLEEIDGLPAILQARIVQLLRDGQFFRPGGGELIAADVRILATTTTDIEAMGAVAFREDLQRLINIVRIEVPPLRERREEIRDLADHFRDRFAREFNRPERGLSNEIRQLLDGYDWPGNVRELENLIKRWVVLGDDAHLKDELAARTKARHGNGQTKDQPAPGPGLREIGRRAARAAEQAALREALERVGGNRAAASRLLKISYKTLLQKLNEQGALD